MPVSGQIIDSPPTRQRIEFLQTAADTDGELLRMRATIGPGGRVPMHVHLDQEERFEILSGIGAFRVNGESVDARAGDRLTVPPGTPHRFRNDSGEDVVVIADLRPAMRSEELFEELFGLAREGRTRGRLGIPGPFQVARLVRDYEREFFYLSALPVGLQRAARVLVR